MNDNSGDRNFTAVTNQIALNPDGGSGDIGFQLTTQSNGTIAIVNSSANALFDNTPVSAETLIQRTENPAGSITGQIMINGTDQ